MFDLLSWRVLPEEVTTSDLLVLNSLSFLKAFQLFESYEEVNYIWIGMLPERGNLMNYLIDPQCKDASILYGYKDLNEMLIQEICQK